MSAPPSAAAAVGPKQRTWRWQALLTWEMGVILVLLLVLVLLALLNDKRPKFYNADAQFDLWRQIAFLGTFAIGEAIVIMTGGIDLSIGSLIAFSSMTAALTMTTLADRHTPLGPAALVGMVAGLVAALVVGLWHGTLVQKLRLPPFVVTLASLSALRSIARLMHADSPIPITNFPIINVLGNEGMCFTLPGGMRVCIPWAALVFVLVAVGAELLLRRTRIGRYVYSVGSNEDATRLSGVSVLKVKLFAYGASGLLAGLASLMIAGYGHEGSPNAGQMYELNAVAAAVIGGCSLTGGRGTVFGTVLGACLLQVILSAINLIITSPARWEGLVVGSVVLMAVLFNVVRQRLVERT